MAYSDAPAWSPTNTNLNANAQRPRTGMEECLDAAVGNLSRAERLAEQLGLVRDRFVGARPSSVAKPSADVGGAGLVGDVLTSQRKAMTFLDRALEIADDISNAV